MSKEQMPSAPKTIPVFEAVEVVEAKKAGPAARPLHARGLPERVVHVVETGVDALSESMKNFVAGVSEMLTAAAAVPSTMTIDTVEVECQISGGGKVGFAGTGLDVQGSSTMKIVFKRKDGK